MSARRRIGVVVARRGLAGALSGTGATAQPAFFDWCDGVDHPPFDRDYPGDGFSFLLYGFAFEPNDDGTFPTGTVEVTGGGIGPELFEEFRAYKGEGDLFRGTAIGIDGEQHVGAVGWCRAGCLG